MFNMFEIFQKSTAAVSVLGTIERNSFVGVFNVEGGGVGVVVNVCTTNKLIKVIK